MASRRPVRVLELRSVWGTGGGPEKTILLGAARTDPARYLVTVCYIRDTRDPVFGPAQKADGLPIDYVEVRERNSFDPSVWGALRTLVREREIEIVHAHDYKTDLLAFLLARVQGVVALSTAHGWAGHSRRELLCYYPMDKRLLARFPRVVAVSSEIRDELVRHGADPTRLTVILNAIDHQEFMRLPERVAPARVELGIPPGAKVIAAVGRLEREKRYDLLLRAFAQMRGADRGCVLVFAGEGSLRSELEAVADDLGIADSCRFLGHCADTPSVYHAADLFVQSSQNEGTPNAVLEAMALETPIVATDVGGTRELVRPDLDALLVPRLDVAGLADAMTRALDDAAGTRARVVSARRRVVHELSFEARMDHLETIYDELADAYRRRAAPVRQ